MRALRLLPILAAAASAGCASPAPREPGAILAELDDMTPGAWVDRVKRLEATLQQDTWRALIERTIELHESDKSEGSKELEAVKRAAQAQLLSREVLTELVVWAGPHEGREGFFPIWNMGERAFPVVLRRLREDAHRYVHMMVAYLLVDYTLGSWRERPNADETMTAFLREIIPSAPEAHRPYYEALLAALGDAARLDAIPRLLDSACATDQAFAAFLLKGMFPEEAIFTKDELHETNDAYCDGKGDWSNLSRKLREWWTANRAAMEHDAKAKHWRVRR